MRRRKHKFLSKPLIGLLIFFLALLIAGVYSAQSVRSFAFFNINSVIIREGTKLIDNNKIDLSYLKGRNIFTINLSREEQFIQRVYPGYKKIKLIRIMPDRIFADFVKRDPLAYVRLYRDFCVDEDLVLFNLDALVIKPDLPVITGIETKIFGAKAGTRYNVKGLSVAIDIIKMAKANKPLKDLAIKKIDAKDPQNISFFIILPQEQPDNNKKINKALNAPRYLEIKIGQDFIDDKINILSSLMQQDKTDWGNIKYIDLRFKEPVMSYYNIPKKK